MKPGNLYSAKDKTQRMNPAQNVFSSKLPGEPGLDFDMCWRCGVQSKPLNYFFGTSKKTLHIKGDLIPALCIAGIVKHFARINHLLKKKGSPNSKHIASLWTQMWPKHMLTTWLLPLVQWNQTLQTCPRLLHHTVVVTELLSTAFSSAYNGVTC